MAAEQKTNTTHVCQLEHSFMIADLYQKLSFDCFSQLRTSITLHRNDRAITNLIFSIGDLCLVLCSHRSHQFAQRIRVSQQEKCLIFIFIVFYLSNFLNINTFFVALFSKFGANIKNIENLNINPWLSTYFIKR